MHCQMGRLFQHQSKGILVDRLHRDLRLGLHPGAVLRQGKGDLLPRPHRAVGQDRLPVGKKSRRRGI